MVITKKKQNFGSIILHDSCVNIHLDISSVSVHVCILIRQMTYL